MKRARRPFAAVAGNSRGLNGKFGSGKRSKKTDGTQCCACGVRRAIKDMISVPGVSTVPAKRNASLEKRERILDDLGVEEEDKGQRFRYCKAHSSPNGGITVAVPRSPPRLTSAQVASVFGSASVTFRGIADQLAFRRHYHASEADKESIRELTERTQALEDELKGSVEALSYKVLARADKLKARGGAQTRSYVGMPSEGLVKAVAVLDACHAGQYWDEVKLAGKQRVRDWRDAVCIMLMKVKTYLSDRSIATMFGLVDSLDDPDGVNGADALVGRIFDVMLPMYVHMIEQTVGRPVEWEDVDRFRHPDFRKDGMHVVYQVNDATTYHCQKSTDPTTNHHTYSAYKGRHGFIVNHVMGPDTLPYANTPAFAARADDSTVMQHPDADFEGKWIEPRPGIDKAGSLGDKGTKARKAVEDLGGVYYEPPFCQDGQMTAAEIWQAEKVAKPRSHVERCIGFPRGHKLLREPVPSSYFPLLDEIVTVATFNIHFTPFVKAMRASSYTGSSDSDDDSDN